MTFLPKNLFFQFSKMTNLYFLVMTVLDWQINDRLPMMMFPLTFVVIVSMIKDIFEDLKRHASDKQENTKKALVGNWQTGAFAHKPWHAVTVGSIVKVHRDEYFPADLILLNSSLPKGLCYIETKDLDGETNLKHKQAEKKLLELGLSTDKDVLTAMKGARISCEQPNDRLYRFEGTCFAQSSVCPLSVD